MTATVTEAVVFDVGNVLIEWDPRRLYRKLLPDDAAVERFLATVCTPEWNAEQDRGRPVADAVATLAAAHPGQHDLIAAYYGRWTEMLGGSIGGTVRILSALRAEGVPCYGLTNFSSETWGLALRRFPFLTTFDGVVVSGREGVIKPDRAIYRRLIARYGLRPEVTAFVDDQHANVGAAGHLGFQATRFESAARLRHDFRRLGLPV